MRRRRGWRGSALAVLVGLSGAGASTAAGALVGSSAAGVASAAHVNVVTWALELSPLNTGLTDVSCTSAGFCAAVGPLDQTPGVLSGLATSTDSGDQWSVSADPSALFDRPNLEQVSCTSSTFCMAVGQYENDVTPATAPLAEAWNGSSWSTVATPLGSLAENTLLAVSCTSSSFCLAVGTTTAPGGGSAQPLAEAWDGSSWSVLPAPAGADGAQLQTVDCTSAAWCLVLGQAPSDTVTGEAPMQLGWDGGALTVTGTAATLGVPSVGGLSCVSTTFCMAAQDNTFAQWNGSGWTALSAAESSDFDDIAAVTCVSTSFCIAVGSRDGHQTSYIDQSLVKEWNGSTWSYVPAANATATTDNDLSGVSCSSASCVAVGSVASPDGVPLGLIEAAALGGGTGPGSTTSGPVTAPIVGMAATPDGGGYWLVGSEGSIYAYGDAVNYGSMRGQHLNAPIVGMAATPDGGGYWLVGSDGGIFSFGDAQFFGSTGALRLNKPVVGMAASPDGLGYWFVASDGGVFAFGDALFAGSTGSLHLNQPVVGMAVDNFSGGYWLVAADGGIFSFNAPFFGSTGGLKLNKPIVGMEADPGGQGYRFVASDGGVFAFDLPFGGSAGGTTLSSPMVGMATSGSSGYWLVGADGGVFAYGGASFEGSPA